MRDQKQAARSSTAGRRSQRLGPLASVSLAIGLLVASVAGGQVPNCDDEKHRQFDFWIGEWRVESSEGQLLGTNRVERMLNGCVLQENWEGAAGSVGKSFNMYDRTKDEWRQTWVDGIGGRLDFVGGLDGEDMLFRAESLAPSGQTIQHQLRFTPLEDGSVRQHWRSSADGKTWQDAFLGFYRRADTAD